MTNKSHWANGSLELLNHGLNHIEQGKEFDLRIAMISIDNSVELSVKTYLSKNRRSLNLGRKELQKSKRFFPQLLDLFANHNQIIISNEDLDAIEYYHSIRNNLYHEGAGINVQESIVRAYYTLAYDLISKLFILEATAMSVPKTSYDLLDIYEIIRVFNSYFNAVVSDLKTYMENYRNMELEKGSFTELFKNAQKLKIIDKTEYEIFLTIFKVRNSIVHEAFVPTKDDILRYISFLDGIFDKVTNLITKEEEQDKH